MAVRNWKQLKPNPGLFESYNRRNFCSKKLSEISTHLPNRHPLYPLTLEGGRSSIKQPNIEIIQEILS